MISDLNEKKISSFEYHIQREITKYGLTNEQFEVLENYWEKQKSYYTNSYFPSMIKKDELNKLPRSLAIFPTGKRKGCYILLKTKGVDFAAVVYRVGRSTLALNIETKSLKVFTSGRLGFTDIIRFEGLNSSNFVLSCDKIEYVGSLRHRENMQAEREFAVKKTGLLHESFIDKSNISRKNLHYVESNENDPIRQFDGLCWKCIAVTSYKNEGKILTFKLLDEYNNTLGSDKLDNKVRQNALDNQNSFIFPAIELPDCSFLNRSINTPLETAQILNQLGFRFYEVKKGEPDSGAYIEVPDNTALVTRFNRILSVPYGYKPLDFISIDGTTEDITFINAYVEHDGVYATKKELIHDAFYHVIPRIMLMIASGGNDKVYAEEKKRIVQLIKGAHRRIEVINQLSTNEVLAKKFRGYLTICNPFEKKYNLSEKLIFLKSQLPALRKTLAYLVDQIANSNDIRDLKIISNNLFDSHFTDLWSSYDYIKNVQNLSDFEHVSSLDKTWNEVIKIVNIYDKFQKFSKKHVIN